MTQRDLAGLVFCRYMQSLQVEPRVFFRRQAVVLTKPLSNSFIVLKNQRQCRTKAEDKQFCLLCRTFYPPAILVTIPFLFLSYLAISLEPGTDISCSTVEMRNCDVIIAILITNRYEDGYGCDE